MARAVGGTIFPLITLELDAVTGPGPLVSALAFIALLRSLADDTATRVVLAVTG